jgi:hypothetical protein
MAAQVFFSYSHADEPLRDEIEKQLSMLKREGVIAAWHDRRISAGTEFASVIDAHVQTADVILLLVSADFLASDYCFDIEVKRAMERHDAGQAVVIPVILRACDWHRAPFGKLNASPRDGKPITQHADRDQALLEVAQAVLGAARRASVKTSTGEDEPVTPTSRNPRLVAETLSDAAREVLSTAADGDGYVYYSAVGTQLLSVGGREFIQPARTASVRRAERVISELSTASCLAQEGMNDITTTATLKNTSFGLDVAEFIARH